MARTINKEELDIGGRIKKIRLRNKMTQAEFGAVLGKSPSTIYAYERNIIIPPFRVLVEISRLFNTDIDYITGFKDFINESFGDILKLYEEYKVYKKIYGIEDEDE